MHNIKRSPRNIKEGITQTKLGLSETKKNFIDNEGLEQCHIDYDQKASSGDLKNLKRKWEPAKETIEPKTKKKIIIDPDKEKKQTAYDLYGSSRPVITKHWENLKKENGNKTIICPMCGLREADEMDHFTPRGLESFPEYATHYTNLIPLCHTCNHIKGEQWLDDNGLQIFFNAYFDNICGVKYLDCNITIDSSCGYPQAEIKLMVDRNKSVIAQRIYDTITKLNLINKYVEVANNQLRARLNEHLNEFRKEKDRYKNVDDFVASKKQLMIDIANDSANDFLTVLVWNAIASSANYWDFFRSHV